MTKSSIKAMSYAILALFFVLNSCSKEQVETPISENESLESRGYGIAFYALTADQLLIKYNTHGKRELSKIGINGLMENEKLIAIDFRPATGQLYGVSNQSRIYTINPNIGKAVAISTSPFTPSIDGNLVGFDFNPTVDRIRLVTGNDQNLRLHPETGAVVSVDGSINPASNEISAVAYTNSFAGATTTALYDLSVKNDKLYLQSNPNGGVISAIGDLGVDINGVGGFDISSDNSIAIAAFSSSSDMQSTIYKIDITTGKAEDLYSGKRNIIGIAIPTTPVAYAVNAENTLLIFNPMKKTDIMQKAITGLASGEKIVGIDLRPATGQLYALVNTSKLYVINTANGAATIVSSTPFTTALHGTSFGMDFNPTVDRIRIISNTGQNLRVHPVTGAIAFVDQNLNPDNPHVDAVAYTNSYAGATTTTLFDVDTKLDMLFRQDPPNAGTLVRVGGGIGINGGSNNGFDIGGLSNKGYGIFDFYGETYLFTMNLNAANFEMIRKINHKIMGFTVGLGL